MNNEFATPNTTSRIFAKRDFQKLRSDFKVQGLNVEKVANGYELRAPNGKLALKAMNGNNSYLVRYVEGLFA